MTQLTMSISGMNCGHCVTAVKTALQQLTGVTVEQVGIGSATVSFDPAATALADITDAVQDAGYEATVAS
jgi:copper chaperone